MKTCQPSRASKTIAPLFEIVVEGQQCPVSWHGFMTDRVRSGPGHPLPSCRSFTMFWKQNFRFRFNFLISYPQTLFVFTAQGISRNKYFIWYLFVGFVVILLVFLHDVSSLDCERELAARKQGQRHQYRTDVGTFWCGSTLLVLSKLYYWL